MIPQEIEILISRYDDADLTDGQRAQLKEILQNQPQAEELLERYRRLDLALAEMADAGPAVDLEGLNENIRAGLDKIDARKLRIGQRVKIIKWLTPIAAAAAIAIAALHFSLYETTPSREFNSAVVRLAAPKTGGNIQKPQNTLVKIKKPAMPAAEKRTKITLAKQASQPVDQAGYKVEGEVIWWATPRKQSNLTGNAKNGNVLGTLFNGSSAI